MTISTMTISSEAAHPPPSTSLPATNRGSAEHGRTGALAHWSMAHLGHGRVQVPRAAHGWAWGVGLRAVGLAICAEGAPVRASGGGLRGAYRYSACARGGRSQHGRAAPRGGGGACGEYVWKKGGGSGCGWRGRSARRVQVRRVWGGAAGGGARQEARRARLGRCAAAASKTLTAGARATRAPVYSIFMSVHLLRGGGGSRQRTYAARRGGAQHSADDVSLPLQANALPLKRASCRRRSGFSRSRTCSVCVALSS